MVGGGGGRMTVAERPAIDVGVFTAGDVDGSAKVFTGYIKFTLVLNIRHSSLEVQTLILTER